MPKRGRPRTRPLPMENPDSSVNPDSVKKETIVAEAVVREPSVNVDGSANQETSNMEKALSTEGKATMNTTSTTELQTESLLDQIPSPAVSLPPQLSTLRCTISDKLHLRPVKLDCKKIVIGPVGWLEEGQAAWVEAPLRRLRIHLQEPYRRTPRNEIVIPISSLLSYYVSPSGRQLALLTNGDVEFLHQSAAQELLSKTQLITLHGPVPQIRTLYSTLGTCHPRLGLGLPRPPMTCSYLCPLMECSHRSATMEEFREHAAAEHGERDLLAMKHAFATVEEHPSIPSTVSVGSTFSQKCSLSLNEQHRYLLASWPVDDVGTGAGKGSKRPLKEWCIRIDMDDIMGLSAQLSDSPATVTIDARRHVMGRRPSDDVWNNIVHRDMTGGEAKRAPRFEFQMQPAEAEHVLTRLITLDISLYAVLTGNLTYEAPLYSQLPRLPPISWQCPPMSTPLQPGEWWFRPPLYVANSFNMLVEDFKPTNLSLGLQVQNYRRAEERDAALAARMTENIIDPVSDVSADSSTRFKRVAENAAEPVLKRPAVDTNSEDGENSPEKIPSMSEFMPPVTMSPPSAAEQRQQQLQLQRLQQQQQQLQMLQQLQQQQQQQLEKQQQQQRQQREQHRSPEQQQQPQPEQQLDEQQFQEQQQQYLPSAYTSQPQGYLPQQSPYHQPYPQAPQPFVPQPYISYAAPSQQGFPPPYLSPCPPQPGLNPAAQYLLAPPANATLTYLPRQPVSYLQKVHPPPVKTPSVKECSVESVRIGKFYRAARPHVKTDINLRFLYGRRSLCIEFGFGPAPTRISVPLEDITAFQLRHVQDPIPQFELIYQVIRPPMFSVATPREKQAAMWTVVDDFTDGEASQYNIHVLGLGPTLPQSMEKHVQLLLHCDTRLHDIALRREHAFTPVTSFTPTAVAEAAKRASQVAKRRKIDAAIASAHQAVLQQITAHNTASASVTTASSTTAPQSDYGAVVPPQEEHSPSPQGTHVSPVVPPPPLVEEQTPVVPTAASNPEITPPPALPATLTESAPASQRVSADSSTVSQPAAKEEPSVMVAEPIPQDEPVLPAPTTPTPIQHEPGSTVITVSTASTTGATAMTSGVTQSTPVTTSSTTTPTWSPAVRSMAPARPPAASQHKPATVFHPQYSQQQYQQQHQHQQQQQQQAGYSPAQNRRSYLSSGVSYPGQPHYQQQHYAQQQAMRGQPQQHQPQQLVLYQQLPNGELVPLPPQYQPPYPYSVPQQNIPQYSASPQQTYLAPPQSSLFAPQQQALYGQSMGPQPLPQQLPASGSYMSPLQQHPQHPMFASPSQGYYPQSLAYVSPQQQQQQQPSMQQYIQRTPPIPPPSLQPGQSGPVPGTSRMVQGAAGSGYPMYSQAPGASGYSSAPGYYPAVPPSPQIASGSSGSTGQVMYVLPDGSLSSSPAPQVTQTAPPLTPPQNTTTPSRTATTPSLSVMNYSPAAPGGVWKPLHVSQSSAFRQLTPPNQPPSLQEGTPDSLPK